MKYPTSESSSKISGICTLALAVLMVAMRPVFRMRPEAIFLGGLFGAILFFFLLIFYGNLKENKGNSKLGWFSIAFCEIGAMTVSLIIHPVCITTCLLFSIPVVIYIKWAATKIDQLRRQPQQQGKKNK